MRRVFFDKRDINERTERRTLTRCIFKYRAVERTWRRIAYSPHWKCHFHSGPVLDARPGSNVLTESTWGHNSKRPRRDTAVYSQPFLALLRVKKKKGKKTGKEKREQNTRAGERKEGRNEKKKRKICSSVKCDAIGQQKKKKGKKKNVFLTLFDRSYVSPEERISFVFPPQNPVVLPSNEISLNCVSTLRASTSFRERVSLVA